MTLQEYAKANPQEYAKKAAEANGECKTLKIKNGALVLDEIKTPIEELKAAKKAEIEAQKAKEEYADIEYAGHTWQADADSQFKLLSAVNICSLLDLSEYVWWDRDNDKVTLKKEQLIELGATIARRSSALVQKARTLKDKINETQTKKHLEAIVWLMK
ncbi:MAG: DUF4376 domain-containing protein [Campylobacteraceae bacterium]|jgi:hypothetical protein|nr:DUF4376 domain-containing protein [Campylobacteraceae bacterium]